MEAYLSATIGFPGLNEVPKLIQDIFFMTQGFSLPIKAISQQLWIVSQTILVSSRKIFIELIY
jgi:hypothetical protein